jgi:MFS family permease
MSGTERYRWIIVGGLFVILVVLFGGFLNFGVFFDPLRNAFSWSHEQTSSLLTALLLALTIASPIVGLMLERVEAQTSMIGGAALAIVAYLIASHAHSYGVMLAAFVILGVALAMSTLVPAQVVIANWFEERLRGTAFGIAAAGTAFGGFVMVLAADAAVRSWGWRGAYLASIVPIAVIVIPVILILVRSRPPGGVAHADSHGVLPGLEIAEGFRTSAFWLIMIAYACYGFAVGLPVAHLIPFFIKLGMTPHAAAMIIAWYEVLGTGAALLMGLFGDRLGGKFALALCFAMMAVSFWALLGASATGLRILFIVLFGFAVASPTGLLALLLAQTLGLKSFGFFSGAGQFVLFLGLSFAPFIGGWIVDVTLSYRDAFGLCALLAVVGGLVSLAVTVPKQMAAASSDSGETVSVSAR